MVFETQLLGKKRKLYFLGHGQLRNRERIIRGALRSMVSMDSNMFVQFSKNFPLPEKENIFLSLSKYEANKKTVKNTLSYSLSEWNF